MVDVFGWIMEAFCENLNATRRCVLLECQEFLAPVVARIVCEYICFDSRVARYASLIHKSVAQFRDGKEREIWKIALYGDETTDAHDESQAYRHPCTCTFLNPYTLEIVMDSFYFNHDVDWITMWHIVFERDHWAISGIVSKVFPESIAGYHRDWDDILRIVNGLIDALRDEIFKEMLNHEIPPKLCDHDVCGFQCEEYSQMNARPTKWIDDVD